MNTIMQKITIFLKVLTLVLYATFGHAAPVVYEIDPNMSELVVRMFRGGFAAFLGHNHVIRATEFSGQIRFDPEDQSTSGALVEVKTASLKADEPQIRAKYKLKKNVSDKDRKKIQKTMFLPKSKGTMMPFLLWPPCLLIIPMLL